MPGRRDLLRRAFAAGYGKGSRPSEGDLIQLDNAIGYIQNTCIKKGDLEEELKYHDEEEKRAYRAYQAELSNRGLLDYESMIVLAYRKIREDGHLRQRWRRRYDHWCVDEAQDASRIQHTIVWLLTNDHCQSLLMVGDVDQSIYGYRGAWPESLSDFPYEAPERLFLETNYRSRAGIVDAAAAFVTKSKRKSNARMVAARPSDTADVEVREERDLTALYDDAAELSRELSETGTVGVLFRENADAIPLIDLFERQGTPFSLLTGKRTFFTCPTVMDVKDFVSLARDPYNERAFRKVYFKMGSSCFLKKSDCEWACRKASRKKGVTLLDALMAQASSYRKWKAIARDKDYVRRLGLALSDVRRSSSPTDMLSALKRWGYLRYLDERGEGTGKFELLKSALC